MVVASLYQTIKCCCAEEKGSGFENLAEKFSFSLEIVLFCLRSTILSVFRLTCGNIYRFLVVFLDVNRLVCI